MGLETQLAEISARIRDVEARLAILEGEAANGRIFSGDATRRIDIMTRAMHGLAGAVARAVEDSEQTRPLTERACRGVEDNARGIARILERLEAALADPHTAVTEVVDGG